jgi:site-specific DNA-methyltransferase (adenine-specific)
MSVRILEGDARAILPTLAGEDIAAVITDPVWPNCPPGLIAGWDRPEELLAESLALLPASVRRVVIVLRSDSDPRFLRAVPARFPFICAQAMSYAVPMYLGRVLGGTELAYCFGEPPPVREGKRVIPMWGPKAQPGSRKANGHPCSRALSHMEWLVDWWALPGETVLDPFCGSGTIPLAADRMQRHGVGIEIAPEYVALARARAAGDAPLFAEAGT